MSSYQLNISEWQRQHSIYVTQQKKYTYELGFAAFYLNRTNRSGMIKGGVIGGKEQSGKWTMGVRFRQEQLSERIREIAGRKSQIRLYDKDTI